MEKGRTSRLWLWTALACYILACIWVEVQYSKILWMIIIVGGPLLVFCAHWKRGEAGGLK